MRAWKLFGICSGVFAPSSKLRLSLLNHLIAIEESERMEISQRACYCISRLEKIYENGTRLVLPTSEEIRCMKAMKAFTVKVYTASGSSIIILLDSFDTANDLKISLIKKLKISVNKFPLFGLYEIFEDEFYEERYIEENELIMDLVSSWTSQSYKLLLKIRIFIYQGPNDVILPFVYIQSVLDVLRGITLISSKLIPVLAALKLSIDKGKSKALEGYLTTNLAFYIPGPYLKSQQLPIEEWVERVLKKYNLLPELSRSQAQAKYIELISKAALYGSCVFYVNFQEASGNYCMPKEVMMSIGPENVTFYTRDHRTELMRLAYPEINSWGVSKDRLALFFPKNGYQVQYLFKTLQGQVIASLMQDYVNAKQGKSIVTNYENNLNLRKLGLSRALAVKFPPLYMNLFR